MQDFLTTTYYNNTVLEWALALGIIAVSVVLGRLLYALFGRYIKHLTQQTKTKLDDLIIDMIEEPVVAILVLLGIRHAVGTLELPASAAQFSRNVFTFVLSLLVAWLVLRFYEALHREYLVRLAARTESDLDDQVLPIVRSSIRFIVIGLGVIVGLNNAGYDVGAVLAGLGIGGLAFALAAQDTVANLFGGITLFLQRPFQPGDYIILDDQWLIVDEIGLRASRLRDYASLHTVYIPNSQFTNNKITNVSRYPGHYIYQRILLSPTLKADQMEQALEIARQIVQGREDVTYDSVRLEELTPDGLRIRVAYAINDYGRRHEAMTGINLALMRQWEAHGIDRALPLYVTMEQPVTQAVPGPAMNGNR